MKTLLITYAWEGNKGGDVEFIAQELESAGISIKLDRWNIKAGKRLWQQIDSFISKDRRHWNFTPLNTVGQCSISRL